MSTKAPALDPDLVDTAKTHPCRFRCDDCAVRLCEGSMCRSCSEVRRLLPRFLSLTKGRAHVLELLAELAALDAVAAQVAASTG